MEILLLGIYSFFVWLIFIKLKWLPWNIATQVIVVIIPIVGMAALILLLNIFAPVLVRRARLQVHGADRVAGAGPGDRGAGRGRQPPGEEGRSAVPDRPDALPARGEHARGAARRRMQGSQRELRGAAEGRRGQDGERAARSAGQEPHARVGARLALARKRVEQYRELAEDRRRQPLRPGAGRDRRARAAGPARRRAQRRGAGRAPSPGAAASSRSSRSSAPR